MSSLETGRVKIVFKSTLSEKFKSGSAYTKNLKL